jgi:hypothetical protein
MKGLALIEDNEITYLLNPHQGNANKFIDNFKNAWRRLPDDVKENILQYWRDSPLPVSFELSTHLNKKDLATVGALGTELKFKSDEFDRMPPEPAQYTIAHELAHVYQFSAKLVTPGNDFKYEDNANDLATKWGFDHIAQMNWRAENILGRKKEKNRTT